MILDATTKSIELILGAAVTTNAMPVTVDYVDLTTTTTLAGSSDTQSNGTTAVTIVAAPAASTQRKVNAITVFNADTAAKVVTIRLNNNTTLRNLISVTLQIGDTIGYADAGGWYLLDSDGNLKSVQSTSASSIATAIHSATGKTTPVDTDELTIVDSEDSNLLKKLTWANVKATLKTYFDTIYAALAGSASQVFSVGDPTNAAHAVPADWVGYYPEVASATTVDIFGAAGATINLTGTTTTTTVSNCTSAQVGSVKRIITAGAWPVTASASLTVDRATSGTTTYPAGAELEISASTTSTFAIRTVCATGTWTPNQGAGLTVNGAFSSSGIYVRKSGEITVHGIFSGATSVASAAAGVMCTNLPYTVNATFAGNGLANNATLAAIIGVKCQQGTTTMYSGTAMAATASIFFSCTYQV